MKKLILILSLALAALYAILAILGSGGEYAAEKLFYSAMQKASKITGNPDVVPPGQLAAIEHDFKLLLKKYPATNTAKIAKMSLLEFYVNIKKFTDAIDLAAVIERDYPGNTQTLSTAQYFKGLAYEKQGMWDKALQEFKILKEKYPATQLGIQMPLYILRYYNTKGLDKEAGIAYDDAVSFYGRMEKEYSGKMLGYTASLFLIQTYLSQRSYEAAGKALDDTLKKYTGPASFMQLLPLVEKIYIEDLNNTGKAIEVYKYALTKTKDAKITNFLKLRIKALESQK